LNNPNRRPLGPRVSFVYPPLEDFLLSEDFLERSPPSHSATVEKGLRLLPGLQLFFHSSVRPWRFFLRVQGRPDLGFHCEFWLSRASTCVINLWVFPRCLPFRFNPEHPRYLPRLIPWFLTPIFFFYLPYVFFLKLSEVFYLIVVIDALVGFEIFSAYIFFKSSFNRTLLYFIFCSGRASRAHTFEGHGTGSLHSFFFFFFPFPPTPCSAWARSVPLETTPSPLKGVFDFFFSGFSPFSLVPDTLPIGSASVPF